MMRTLILVLFVLFITACEKQSNDVVIPVEETANKGE